MALIATVGGSTSNSYVTVDEADVYFATRYNSAAWSALSAGDKAAALITATEQIDRLAFKYSKYGSELESASNYQRLEFPRGYTVNADAVAIIPLEVKRACFEQAFFIIGYGSETDKRAALQAQGVSSFSVGGVDAFNAPAVSESYNASGVNGSNGICAAAKKLLARHFEGQILLGRA